VSSGKGLYGEANWFATLRGRVGVPLGEDARVFASAGPAVMRAGASTSDGFGTVIDGDRQRLTGKAAGIGMEVALSPGRHVTIEYLYADFDESDEFVPESESGGTLDPIVQTFRISYTFRF
jgi:opacity protein-like surface antigen